MKTAFKLMMITFSTLLWIRLISSSIVLTLRKVEINWLIGSSLPILFKLLSLKLTLGRLMSRLGKFILRVRNLNQPHFSVNIMVTSLSKKYRLFIGPYHHKWEEMQTIFWDNIFSKVWWKSKKRFLRQETTSCRLKGSKVRPVSDFLFEQKSDIQ